MPRGVPTSGMRITKKRLEAFQYTNPDLVMQHAEFRKKQGKQPLVPTNVSKFPMARNINHPANYPIIFPVAVKQEKIEEESEESILARLNSSFNALRVMAEATVRGINRSFIVSGPAGLGKSFEVDNVVNELRQQYRCIEIKGNVKPTGLYKTLYEYRHENCCVIFDDADSAFGDDISLNILKTATDTTDKRFLNWLTETAMETENGEPLPRRFEFKGSVIFLTNYKMDYEANRGGRLAEHFKALISRSHYLDLGMNTNKDYLVRIKMVVADGMLIDRGFSKQEQDMILEYIFDNSDRLRELSLRMVLKLAMLYKMSPTTWQDLASATCCKR